MSSPCFQFEKVPAWDHRFLGTMVYKDQKTWLSFSKTVFIVALVDDSSFYYQPTANTTTTGQVAFSVMDNGCTVAKKKLTITTCAPLT